MSARNNVVLCFTHLRWDFVYQRPQHVMSRFAADRAVFYYEEPKVGAGTPYVSVRNEGRVTIVTPTLPAGLTDDESQRLQRLLLDEFVNRCNIADPLLWYYTPMALRFSDHLDGLRVYDCMDQLAAFKDAPPQLHALEKALLASSALVFTGGRSLYYAKRHLHPNVYCFPSAVDAAHFRPANRPEPTDLQTVPRPRLIFYGVIDERFDIEFVRSLSSELSDWQIVLVGPTTKVDPAKLPRAANIQYVGMRSYDELPAYLEHCDVALLPFALNEATRFISPTKTLEYLAAGKPVISTPIADVVDPYGTEGAVHIAATPREAACLARTAAENPPTSDWHRTVDELLGRASWGATVAHMDCLIADARAADAALEAAG